MTEEEAKTKACFEAATFAASQQIADGPGPHCIGSACMAWRWAEPPVPARVETSETGTDKPRVKIKPPSTEEGWLAVQAGKDKPDKAGGPPWRWIVWHREIAATPGDGYCGIAGKP